MPRATRCGLGYGRALDPELSVEQLNERPCALGAVDGGIYANDVSDDGRTLVTAGTDGIVHLWNIASGAPIASPMTGLKPFPTSVDISPDGSAVVGADSLGNVLLWDISTGTLIAGPLPGPSHPDAVAASFVSGGRRVVVVSATGTAWLWDIDPSDWEVRACEMAGRSLTHEAEEERASLSSSGAVRV